MFVEKQKEVISIIDNTLEILFSYEKKTGVTKFQSLNLWNIQETLLVKLLKFEINGDDDIFEIKLWSLIDENFEYVNYKGDFETEKEKLIKNLTLFKNLVLKM